MVRALAVGEHCILCLGMRIPELSRNGIIRRVY